MKEKSRGTFNGSIGFVLAAAGSAVGLGNIWRFPFLAARDGGGLFLVIYIVLALTFGFTLLTTEICIGRNTKQSPLAAYKKLHGWVIKYFVTFLTGGGKEAAADGYFGNFITGTTEPAVYMTLFLAACALIIFVGVEKGIEKTSKIMMPILFVLVVIIAVFSLTIRHTHPDGQVVTGLQGLKIYLIPRLDGIGVKEFFRVLMDALGQLFYSLSIAMGILIAYGSYMPDDTDIVKSVNQIEIFDTLVAFLAGVMIIPAVYVFMGAEGMSSGPSLMFVSLPKIFAEMGALGDIVGTVFFALVLFAAITSGMSIMEAVVSSFMDEFKLDRTRATVIEGVLALVIGLVVCFGYNFMYFEFKLPNGSVGQVLDIMDYVSNYIMMPIVAIATCILIGWVLKVDVVIGEATKNGEKFSRKGLYVVMIRFIAPLLLGILLLMSLGLL